MNNPDYIKIHTKNHPHQPFKSGYVLKEDMYKFNYPELFSCSIKDLRFQFRPNSNINGHHLYQLVHRVERFEAILRFLILNTIQKGHLEETKEIKLLLEKLLNSDNLYII
jgi:hypothetical protein